MRISYLLTAFPFLAAAVAVDEKPRSLNVTLDVEFLDLTPDLGIKLINNHPTRVKLLLTNHEPRALHVDSVGGRLWNLKKDVSVHNLTALKLGRSLPPAKQLEVLYPFTNDLTPQDLLLNLGVAIRTAEGEVFTVTAFNGTVTVVEAPSSLLDPQLLFLYLLLGFFFALPAYYVYNKWLAAVLPKTRRTKSDSVRLVRSTDAPASAEKYDESWIPQHHIKKPTAAKPKGGVKNRKGGD